MQSQEMFNFDVPIDVEAFGLTAEDLFGKPEREPLYKFWDKRKQAIMDLGIDMFRPFTRTHEAFLKSTSHESALLGGNSSAKTWTSIAKHVAIMVGKHPTIHKRTPCTGWVACEDFSLNRDGPLKAMLTLGQNYIADYGAHDKIVKWKNGSETFLKSYESGWKKFQAAAVDVINLDEESPEEIYKECMLRTLRTSGYIFTSMTPLEGLTWMYDKLFEDENNFVDVYSVSLFDNYTLKDEDIIRTINNYDQQERDARIYGRFTQMAGLVYPTFRKGIHTIAPFKLNKDYVVYIGIDPHITTPTAVVFLAVGKLGDMYVIKELFIEGSIPDICAKIKAESQGYRMGWTAMDSSARTDIKIFDQDIYSGFVKEGLNPLLAPKGPGSVGKGVSEIKEMLKPNKLTGKPVLRWFDTCKMGIKSMQTLSREQYHDEGSKGKKDKLAEGKHHMHAALRYIYQLNPYYFEPMPVDADNYMPMDEVVGY